ncbi:septation ring formation regulator EzrA [Bacillus toyonensis]|uniref:septation ring formation regulator EzrA n=1 Tax=Bacillus toyonensis TaxID=155322 RepID=UPI000B44FF78|nr:septation ring formation regulator EzrA [Bacillus toyonensis]MCA1044596.1 septation ring formation regulator EzrA [Bacillus toyonensis]MDO8159107.1 septation ring formation regulator EzrA [Bacillus toyonensis]MED3198112.1 septation ring formation regulator EzrA [Bacillus toyonensis]OTX08530.1 septation ring formation regulator EzrA [Bacillus thuringiensis serovar seoulensis]
MNKEKLLQELNNLQYSDNFVDDYRNDEKIDKKKINRTKEVVTKTILMKRCYEVVQEELQGSEEILYSMLVENSRVKNWQTGTAMTLGVGVLAINFGINNVLIVTNKRLYVFFVDRYYNEVDIKVCVLNEIASMRTILDRKGGSEFLHIKYKNDKEYVLLGNADDYRELFQIVGRLKVANGIELKLQDKKLKRKLTLKRSVFNIIMYALVIYILYKAYINFMP